MIVTPIHAALVRVDDAHQERYAVAGPSSRWTWDHTGRAVCPLTQLEIDRALSTFTRSARS